MRRGVRVLAIPTNLSSEKPNRLTSSEDLVFLRKAAAGETIGGSTLGVTKLGSLDEALAGRLANDDSRTVGALKNLEGLKRLLMAL